jgi:hypothetical protein
LSEYEFEIRYRRGSSNSNADALSRLPVRDQADEDRLIEVINTLEMSKMNLSNEDIRFKQRNDPGLQDIVVDCLNNVPTRDQMFELKEDILYRRKKNGSLVMVVPWDLVENILYLHHSNDLSVHMSRDRMQAMLKSRYYWSGMNADISNWVNACKTCSRVKANQPKSNGLLVPIVTSQPFEMVGMDIVGPFKTSTEGFNYILTCVDMYTSWVEAEPLKTITAQETCSAFFKVVIARHGCPIKVLTDQGKQFTSKLFNRICTQYHITHLESTAYHHQTNGKVERFHKFLENSLATIIKPDQSNWSGLVENCLFVYRATLSRMLDETPFFLVYGRDPVMPQDLLIDSKNCNRRQISSDDVDEYKTQVLKILRATYEKLNGHKAAVQSQYKAYYDRTHREVEFEVDDEVMVYFPVSHEGLSYKLLPKWDGPFRVVQKTDSVTYRLRRDSGKKLQTLLVHVQRMKKYKPWSRRNKSQ